MQAAPSPTLVRLDHRRARAAVAALCARDADLRRLVGRDGPPPLWARRPGFATLVRIVLEQQVSLASARAACDRLRRGVGRITPGRIARLSPRRFARLGITRQKAGFLGDLARALVSGEVVLGRLARSDDATARATLLAIRGVGAWTADIYLIMALRRPDVWPAGDLALARTLQRVRRLRTTPTPAQSRRMARRWAPWRAVAARILWHHYLRDRRARLNARRAPGPRARRAARPRARPAGQVRPAACSNAARSSS